MLNDWLVVYDKPSQDGSAKLNIRPVAGAATPGVLYEIDDGESEALALAEPGYRRILIEIDGMAAVTFAYEGAPTDRKPYEWYVGMAMAGANAHGMDGAHLISATKPDPLAPGLLPATEADLDAMQSILSVNLASHDDRYTIHPGDLSWWMYHDDPRYPDSTSYWLQERQGLLVVEGRSREISVFTLPGVDRAPLIDWAQRRRLGGSGQVGWVSDDDEEMITYLRPRGYAPNATYRSYRWDLTTTQIPDSSFEPGWEFRPVSGEGEANSRRAASHAAFESTMGDAMHLERYLRFMRSPRYEAETDLVAVSPDGRVGSFMIWWGDPSGVAQIEPFGTHPDFQRRGIGKSLIYFALRRMRDAGYHTVRVLTDEPREATAFYEGVGFSDVGRLRWWKPGADSRKQIMPFS